jgi:hypothetical protein
MTKKGILNLWLICTLGLSLHLSLDAQSQSKQEFSWLDPADSLDYRRLTWFALGGGLAYTGSFALLNEYWYKQYPRGGFRFFNDWKEWNQMDKAGHVFGGYFQSNWAYGVYRWIGYEEDPALGLAMGTSLLVQSTIEVMDGFSEDWGFSWPDMAANVLGTGMFGLQQWVWGEQRVSMKVLSYRKNYDQDPILAQRAQALFGKGYLERYLKDYNAQTLWVTTSWGAWTDSDRLPPWLGLGLGYGANHLMGGFSNQWEVNGQIFRYDAPRTRDLYLSLDVDLEKIRVNSPWLKTTLKVLNLFKIPLPGIVIGQSTARGCLFCY